MQTRSKLISLFFVLFSLNILAYKGEYRLGLVSNNSFNPNAITHIIVVGSAAKEDSDQFFQSGLSRALKYKEVFSNDQVIIISSPEVVDRDDEKVFSDFKVNVVKKVDDTLSQDKLVAEFLGFSQIASIDFFGHSSPWGFKLGKKDAAFDPSSMVNELTNLKSHMMSSSYITFSSCNSGFNVAPDLSKILEIPVAGTLTSGLFERLENDGHWYKEDDWTASQYTENNPYSFKTNVSCDLTGACTRMKPSRFNYSSYWGSFDEGGLSFTKFFCHFKNSNYKCEKAMALSLLTFPSVKAINSKSSVTDFKAVVFDWLCQTSTDRNTFTRCVNGIESAVARGDLVFKSHTGNELNCDFESCHAKVVCKDRKIFGSGPRAGTCKLETTTVENPTNVAREFLSFLTGFNNL
jgi:hypothetical protein